MNPGVVLALNHTDDASNRVAEASDTSRDLKRFSQRALFGGCVVHNRRRSRHNGNKISSRSAARWLPPKAGRRRDTRSGLASQPSWWSGVVMNCMANLDDVPWETVSCRKRL